MRISRVREKRHVKHWPAETVYYAEGFVMENGKRWRVTGIGYTPAQAKIDLLHQQGRRRVSWWDRRYRSAPGNGEGPART